MTIRKSILLFLGLSMIAALVACSSSSKKTPPPPVVTIAATSGGGQNATVGTAFASPLVATVTTGGTPTASASVTFTAPTSGASCTFANSTNTETDTANASGVATSSVCTATTTAGAYNVTASTTGAATAASFALTNTAGAAAAIKISSGNNQNAAPGATFAGVVAQVTDSNSNGVSGVAVTFTATAGGTGSAGTFTSTSSSTETVNTDANGNATVSDLVANATTGAFTVTADFVGDTGSPASFTENITTAVTALSDGNYVFSLSGFNVNDVSQFFVAGVFTVSGGTITGGEQDYVDAANYSNANLGGQDLINPTGSSITATADGNLQIVLTTCSGSTCTSTDGVVGVSGVETINVALRPSKMGQGVITEFDGSGSASGELRPQDSTAASTTPSLGYAFEVSGYDNGTLSGGVSLFNLNVGGILNVDGSGTISGTGSIYDADDGGTTFSAQTLQASTGTVSAPDAFGRVVFSITPTDTTDFAQIAWVGYIADTSRVYLVETADSYVGTTGGVALSQGANTGAFGSILANVVYGAAMTGFNANGALQLVGEFRFSGGNTGTVSGFIDFNDLVASEPASPDPVNSTSYTLDNTGRVTITGLTDGTNTFNLQFYIDGNGQAVAISLDNTDNLGATLGGQVNNTGLTDANFSGTYALSLTGWNGTEAGEVSGAGIVTATGTGDTLSGTVDLNFFGATTTGEALSGTYTFLTASEGFLSPMTITGLDVDSLSTASSFNGYEINPSGDTVLIELDLNQLTVGFAQH